MVTQMNNITTEYGEAAQAIASSIPYTNDCHTLTLVLQADTGLSPIKVTIGASVATIVPPHSNPFEVSLPLDCSNGTIFVHSTGVAVVHSYKLDKAKFTYNTQGLSGEELTTHECTRIYSDTFVWHSGSSMVLDAPTKDVDMSTPTLLVIGYKNVTIHATGRIRLYRFNTPVDIACISAESTITLNAYTLQAVHKEVLWELP